MSEKIRKGILLCCLLLPTYFFAQSNIVKGVVSDMEQNEGLIGVTVLIKGTETGTITDFEGKFSIQVKSGQTLRFTYIGYEAVEVKIDNQKNIEVRMSQSQLVIDEVVVVGYGVQKKASSVGSITSSKGDDLLKTGGVTSVSEALQGQMAGVVAVNKSAKPGVSATDLYIRGVGTWGNSSPLILVDGVERDINDLDMNEIETISVLKDASATAVFGVKGGNGVILVTTKRGVGIGKKPEVSFTANFGLKQPSSKLEWADYPTSMNMYNEAQTNDKQWDKLIPGSTISAWENAIATGNYGPYNEYFPQIDWWDETVRDFGTQQNYNVNMRGETARTNYFVSLGYLYDGDIYKTEKQANYDPSFNYKRYNWRSNFDFKLSESTTLSMNIAGNSGNRNQPLYRGIEWGDVYFFKPFLRTPTNEYPIKYADGEWGDNAMGDTNLLANMTTGGQRVYKSMQSFYDVFLTQKLDFLIKGLSAKLSVSYTSYSETQSQILNGGIYGAGDDNAVKTEIRYFRKYDYSKPITNEDGSISYPLITNTRFPNETATEDLPVGVVYDSFESYNQRIDYGFSLDYNRSFGNHNVSALALAKRRMTQSTSTTSVQFPAYEEDWVGRLTYNWKEIYLAEVNAAYNGSEKFAPGKRFGFFPSFSLGWRVSEEPWIKWEDLSNLKLRYSYGQVGNDRGATRFSYIQLFDTEGNTQFGQNQSINYGPVYLEGTPANPDATWEVSTKQNLGLEFGVFGKLNVTLDLFNEHRTNILMQRQTMAAWFGADLPSVNYGETKNHGFEFEIGWNDKIGKDFRYWTKFNIAGSENRVIFKDDPMAFDEYLKAAGKPIGVQSKYLATGNYTSIDDVFNGPITKVSGVNQSSLIAGDLFYVDYNGDGVINTNDLAPVEQLTYPLTTCSFSFGVNYKNIGFSALLYAAPDVYKESIAYLLWDFPESNIKAQPTTLSRWTLEDINADGPVRPAVHLINSHNAQESTYSYTDHSYIRLKNLEVSYKLPKKILQKINMTKCEIFMNGSNLFTLTNSDPRRDPETQADNVYPIIKRYNFGIRSSF